MKSKNSRVSRLFVFLSACALGLSACGGSAESSAIDATPANQAQLAEATPNHGPKLPHGQYKEGYVLVKSKAFEKSMLGQLKSQDIEPLYQGSSWYEIQLANDQTSQEAVDYLDELGCFEDVDYDYIMASDGEIESIDVSSNPLSTEQAYIESQGIGNAWGHLKQEGKHPGGSRDVVVAVIDTGVDYNHIDLRNNIWTNAGEIPNNGVDDDKNGYVDDYFGWDCVGEDNDPMDDNGHGTHVAGIVAAENNNIGTVGVAYNCRVMCIKAGNSSGYFNNSDIAQAIQYAYMNGASVINMSFGGTSISKAVEDALEDAYNQCVLVAAAGNDGLCNQPGCPVHTPATEVIYPAALSYVIGVMSSNNNGTTRSYFSNFDHFPDNSFEYETFACGEQIPSTWPNNKLARLSGTSMASPVVSGIAALLRSHLPDRQLYSNKYIQSQIVNTGSLVDGSHTFANVYDAFLAIPKPSVSLYDYYIFDNSSFSSQNNENGIAEAGETIRVAIELRNRGGVASNVIASIDTSRFDDPQLTDPYFSIVHQTIELSDVGTYSVRDCGKIFNDAGSVVGTQTFFEIVVSDDCPNDYTCTFCLHIGFQNGLDANDHTIYNKDCYFDLTIQSGYVLPALISEDVVFASDKQYLVASDVIIPAGVNVVFEEGTQLIFYQNKQDYYDDLLDSPRLYVFGSLLFNGSEDNMIRISASELFDDYLCMFVVNRQSSLVFNYCDINGIAVGQQNGDDGLYVAEAYHCSFRFPRINYYFSGGRVDYSNAWNYFHTIQDSAVVYESVGIPGLEYDMFTTTYVYDFVNNLLSIKPITTPGDTAMVCRHSFCGNVVNGRGGTIDIIPQQSSELMVKNNVFMSDTPTRHASDLTKISLWASAQYDSSGNDFLDAYSDFWASVIQNNPNTDGTLKIQPEKNTKLNELWPFIVGVKVYDDCGQEQHTLTDSSYRLEVVFNREMDTAKELKVCYGSKEPFSDYQIPGGFVDSTTWVGELKIKAFIEGGEQHFRVAGASLPNEDFHFLANKGNAYFFNYDKTSATAMNLQAFASNSGIDIEWVQDDYDTLMGYNIYRSTEKDGNYVKLNPSVIPAGENTFVDENAEPGVNYWYTFTVVFSDMTESAPAGKVSCRALDTIAPSVYHTPVNQGYLDNNLVISCTASDNIGITGVTLYYRTVGEESWKTLSMSKQNDRYSATVFGNELSLKGLEYYIVASDGVNTIFKGNAETPYTVLIKDASAISRIGDVDGDGVVTTRDALMIIQSINGDLLLSDDEFIRADLNGDGVLNSMEALRILQYINGNVNSLSM